MLDIILRTCSRRESQVHGTERIHPKEEILLKCLNSVINSINESTYRAHIKLTIVDDHSSEEIQEILKNYADVFIPLDNITGNSASLHTVYDYAKENCTDLIYFLEDDYLHESVAIKEMLDFYYNAKIKLESKEVVVYPLDCNDRYKSIHLTPSFIVSGDSRYWRTINSTTGTFLISSNLFTKFFHIFKQFADYGVNPHIHEETTINNIWRSADGAICFSPIPTLAYHLQIEEHLPLYTNYKLLWDNISTDNIDYREKELSVIEKIKQLFDLEFISKLARADESIEKSLFYNNDKLEFLYNILKEINPKKIIEIGACRGEFAYFCLTINPDINKIIVFSTNSKNILATTTINKYFKKNHINAILGSSNSFENINEDNIDLVCIDGNYSDLEISHKFKIPHILIDLFGDQHSLLNENSILFFIKENNNDYQIISDDNTNLIYLKRNTI